MRYCADTWFFLRIVAKDPRALEVARQVREGAHGLLVPSVVGLELTRVLAQRGHLPQAQQVLDALPRTRNVHVVPVDLALARRAGELSAFYAVPSVDALVAATSIATGSDRLLSDDEHFEPLVAQRLLKTESW